MRDFDIRSIEFDLLAAQERQAERLAVRRAILDGEARQHLRVLPWLRSVGARFGSRR